jgi:hypothetical protein
MTRDEFAHSYLLGAEMTREEFDACYKVVECECGLDYCEGWLVVSRTIPADVVHELTQPRKEST